MSKTIITLILFLTISLFSRSQNNDKLNYLIGDYIDSTEFVFYYLRLDTNQNYIFQLNNGNYSKNAAKGTWVVKSNKVNLYSAEGYLTSSLKIKNKKDQTILVQKKHTKFIKVDKQLPIDPNCKFSDSDNNPSQGVMIMDSSFDKNQIEYWKERYDKVSFVTCDTILEIDTIDYDRIKIELNIYYDKLKDYNPQSGEAYIIFLNNLPCMSSYQIADFCEFENLDEVSLYYLLQLYFVSLNMNEKEFKTFYTDYIKLSAPWDFHRYYLSKIINDPPEIYEDVSMSELHQVFEFVENDNYYSNLPEYKSLFLKFKTSLIDNK